MSGSIDPDDVSPQAAAWREILEETTLDRSSLELMRQGKSYVLPDESIGREWTIYPFAFRLKDPSEGGKGEKGITLDWEHDTWAWYDPMEIEDSENFGAVPRLAESLRRVWFEKDLGAEAGAVLTNGLDRLKGDHESGARQLASAALEILRDIVSKMDTEQQTKAWWTKIRFAAWHIWKNGRESMGAAILSVLLSALKSMEEMLQTKDNNSPASLRDAFVQELDRRIAARQDAAHAISVAFANLLQNQFTDLKRPVKILTLSESSTVTHALRHVVSDRPVDLRILESRPLFEGVSLANALADRTTEADKNSGAGKPRPGLSITVHTDASAALAAKDIDMVLLGADRIAEDGAVSNKTGSLPAVLSAKHVSAKAKTVILSESEKVALPGAAHAHVEEDNEPTQLSRAWQADFNSQRVRTAAGTASIRNVFFEWVPPELVDVYVTEQGGWTVHDIRKLSETLRGEEERLFKDI